MPSSQDVSTKLQRIATLAKEAPDMAFTSLSHHIDLDLLREAYRQTRKDGATGVDGQTAEEYAADLEVNLQSLLDRAKSGRYRAPAVKRAYVPKGDGRQKRPIGIPTFEDKVLQKAAKMVLEPVYEQDFLNCSWGYRPRRDRHGALDVLRKHILSLGACWILEVDLRSYFDTVDRGHLQEILRQRVRDGVIVRLIGKWLNAGVLEEGELHYPKSGTPQGGVISPLLANIYLHEVLDKWFEEEVRPRLQGRSFLVRYADDFVMGFATEKEAQRVLEALARRFDRYGLRMHPDKTRLFDFRPSIRRDDSRRPGGGASPRSFDFVGFAHFWARARKGGLWTVKQKTARDRLARAIHRTDRWCRRHRHIPIRDQHAMLVKRLRGLYDANSRPGNSRALSAFDRAARRSWRKWLSRRSSKSRLSWDAFVHLLKQYPLPAPRMKLRSVRP